MTLKELFIGGHILYADCPLSRCELDDAVDQQEWISMWDDFANRNRVERSLHGHGTIPFGVRSTPARN
jgi:hypothetical protein